MQYDFLLSLNMYLKTAFQVNYTVFQSMNMFYFLNQFLINEY